MAEIVLTMYQALSSSSHNAESQRKEAGVRWNGEMAHHKELAALREDQKVLSIPVHWAPPCNSSSRGSGSLQ